MQPPRLRITIRFLLALLAIIAIAMGAAVTYLRSRQATNVAFPGARAVLPGNEADVRSLSFSADGRTLAVAGTRGSIQLWDTSNAWLLAKTPVSPRALHTVSLSSDGRSIAVADSDEAKPSVRQSTLRLLSVSYGMLRLPEMGWVKMRGMADDGRIYGGRSLVLSPDNRRIASGAHQSVEIRDRTTLALVRTLSGAFKIPSCLTFSPDGQLLAIGDVCGGLGVVNLKDGSQAYWRPEVPNEIVLKTRGQHGHLSQYGHYRGVRSLIFCDGANRLLSLGEDNYVKVWDLATGDLLNSLKIGDLSGWADRRSVIAVVSGGKRIVTASKTGDLAFWELATGQRLNSGSLWRGQFVGPSYRLDDVAISPDGKTLAGVVGTGGFGTTAESHRVVLWDIGDLQQLPRKQATPPAAPLESGRPPR